MEENTQTRLAKLEVQVARVEVHSEYTRERCDVMEGKLDQLLARPSSWSMAGDFVRAHWKTLAIIVVTLVGGGWAAPILAALK